MNVFGHRETKKTRLAVIRIVIASAPFVLVEKKNWFSLWRQLLALITLTDIKEKTYLKDKTKKLDSAFTEKKTLNLKSN